MKNRTYEKSICFVLLVDSKVGYWEPAKKVAKLRDMKTDNNTILLKTNFFAGHGGSSGRFSYLEELSYRYALIFEQYVKTKKTPPKTSP